MDLTSQAFALLFLPLSLAVFAMTGRLPRLAVAAMVSLSLLYYALADWAGLPVLVASMTVNYAIGHALARLVAPERRHRASSATLIAGIGFNVALLAWIKYAGDVATGVVIPLGVSFFTFQQIIYLVDVYRDEPPARGPIDYAMLVAFFPKVTAGPLLRHGEFLAQLARPQFDWTIRSFNLGAALASIGLVKKLVLAASLAPYADRVFAAAATGATLGAADAWAGASAYGLQLYFDFSGYSDIAIGIAAMFGLTLPFNFNSPYRAASLIDFWKRWHITLSAALFEFVYFPVAASAARGSKVRPYVAVVLTMAVCGVWHGAGTTFLLWGLLHGIFLCINHGWRAFRGRRRSQPTPIVRLLSTTLTFASVILAWTFFRADSLPTAWTLSASMFGAGGLASPLDVFPGNSGIWRSLGILAAGLAIVWWLPNSQQWAAWAAELGGPAVVPEPRSEAHRAPASGWHRLRRAMAATALAAALVAAGLFSIDWILGRFVFAPMKVADCTATLTQRTTVLRPHCTGEMYHPDYGRLPYVTNSLGMRDQDYDRALYRPGNPQRRVLAVGNSFTFGAGVGVDDVFHAIIERRNPRLVFFNAGFTVDLNGSADVVEHFAPLTKPDLVLMTTGTADLAALAVNPSPEDDRRDRQRSLAVLTQFVKEQLLPPYIVLLAKGMLSSDWLEIYREKLDLEAEARYGDFTETMRRMQRTLAGAQPPIPLVVLIIPQVEQVNGFLDGRPGVSSLAPSAHLRARLEAEGIRVIDSVPYFQGRPDAVRLFYPRDRHLTAEGHRVVADFLESHLSQLMLTPPTAAQVAQR